MSNPRFISVTLPTEPDALLAALKKGGEAIKRRVEEERAAIHRAHVEADSQPFQDFLDDLTALTEKHGVRIEGNGCEGTALVPIGGARGCYAYDTLGGGLVWEPSEP